MPEVQFMAYEDLAVSSTAVGFTAATYLGANYAYVTVEGAPIRFRMDAGTPTTSVGTRLEVGDSIVLESRDEVVRFKAIYADSVAATLRAQFGVRK